MEIVNYRDEHAHAFKELNLAWLDQYELTESHDLMILDDPKKTILDGGGQIFLAIVDGEVVGTSAIINLGNGEFELAKMTVAPAHRGKAIGQQLMAACIDAARKSGGHEIHLYSNSKLTSALKMYTSAGFQHVPVKDAPFETADVQMKLVL